ncbi:MAG: acyltransferase [Bacteroidetes bacterium]|nr:acyltransferase [Bacteroidota bacterium]
MKPALPNIKYLHIVRGLAALLVVAFHAKYIFWVGGTIYNKEIGLHGIGGYAMFAADMLSSCGKECVVIFFILSAFVIKHSFSGHHYTWKNFYTIRLIRIYWPFLCSLFLSILAVVICIRYINPAIYTTSLREYNTRLSTSYNELSFLQVLKTICFIDKGEFAGFNYAYWSLGHELLFYILFPFYNKLNKYSTMIAVAAAYIILFLVTHHTIFYYQIFFIAGLMLYQYFFNHSKQPVIKNKILYQVVLVFFFIAVNLANKAVSEKCSDIVTLVYAFFIFDYIIYFIAHKNKWGMKLGDISYSLYLNHLPILLFYYSVLTLFTGQLVFYSRVPYYTGVIIAVLFTIPLYWITEKPSVAFLKRFRK